RQDPRQLGPSRPQRLRLAPERRAGFSLATRAASDYSSSDQLRSKAQIFAREVALRSRRLWDAAGARGRRAHHEWVKSGPKRGTRGGPGATKNRGSDSRSGEAAEAEGTSLEDLRPRYWG